MKNIQINKKKKNSNHLRHTTLPPLKDMNRNAHFRTHNLYPLYNACFLVRVSHRQIDNDDTHTYALKVCLLVNF